jgi:hypothetical protein
MVLKEKFIAFIDILGFKNMVNEVESESGLTLEELLKILSVLGHDKKNLLEKYGPLICPQSTYENKDLDFQLTQISDCVVISCEVSPSGIINLISHCSGIVVELLLKGILCRGYITKGLIYHTDKQFIGSGYQNALAGEKEVSFFSCSDDFKGTPFVEVDLTVSSYINTETDSNVKKVFYDSVKTVDNSTAIFPFQRFRHVFSISETYNLDEEKQANQNVRNALLGCRGKLVESSRNHNLSVQRKIDCYLRAIDEQLVLCKNTDIIIDELNQKMV